MKILTENSREYVSLASLGSRNRTVLDKLCAALLAIGPLTQYYRGVFQDFAITSLVIILPWLFCRFSSKNLRKPAVGFSAIIGLLLFFIYRSFFHGIEIKNVLFNFAVAFVILSAIFECVNVRTLIFISSRVAALASILIVIQTTAYYTSGRHIQMAPTSLFTEEAAQWVLLAKTGTIGITQVEGKLYRPSAFFMEPSHMFLYTFPHLILMLFSDEPGKMKVRQAVLYSAGLVLSTSGMGIAVTVCAWAAYFSVLNKKEDGIRLRNLLLPVNFFVTILFGVLVVCTILFVPTVRSSVLRVLDFSEKGAIAGRTRLASSFLRSMSIKSLVFGVSNTIAGINFNMPGFVATLYKFGIIGTILSYTTYLYSIFKGKLAFFLISIIIMVVSLFSAQTHGISYMLYYTLIVLADRKILTRTL